MPGIEKALCKRLLLPLLLMEEEEEKEFGFGHFRFEVPFRYPDGKLEVRD